MACRIVGPLEHELTQRCFEARRKMCETRRAGDTAQYEYWRGIEEAYRTAAQLAEKYGR